MAEEFKNKGNVFFQKGDYETALLYYQEAINVQSGNPILYSNKAMALIKLERWKDALVQCELGLSKVDSLTDSKVVQKLEWRKDIAQQNLAQDVLMVDQRVEETQQQRQNVQPVQQSTGRYIDIPIFEVDKLPVEF